jgi:hypothetical protein
VYDQVVTSAQKKNTAWLSVLQMRNHFVSTLRGR